MVVGLSFVTSQKGTCCGATQQSTSYTVLLPCGQARRSSHGSTGNPQVVTLIARALAAGCPRHRGAHLEGCVTLADGGECRLPLLQQGRLLCMHSGHVLGSPRQRLSSISAILRTAPNIQPGHTGRDRSCAEGRQRSVSS